MITFRPYDNYKDAARLRDWLNTPHVYAWWGKQRVPDSIGGPGEYAATLDQVHRDFGANDPDTHYYIIELDGEPIGLIQWARVEDYEDYIKQMKTPNAVGIDLLIGELDKIGKGIGPQIIRQFTREVAIPESGLDLAVTDPEEANPASWRAFEKAGFTYVRNFIGEGGHDTRLMMYKKGDE